MMRIVVVMMRIVVVMMRIVVVMMRIGVVMMRIIFRVIVALWLGQEALHTFLLFFRLLAVDFLLVEVGEPNTDFV